MISVIIPVYNSSIYIKRCFDSIISQSYKDWKVIAVDDGSTDHSFDVMREYQLKDKRFNIYHQSNAGAGAARNLALEICKNDENEGYIVFIDSDDYIDSDYFELLASHSEDVVFIDLAQVNNVGKIIKHESMSTYEKYDCDTLIRKQMTGCIPWGACRKAFKSSLLLDNDIRFSTHKVGEEAVFSFKALYYSRSVGFIHKYVYSYVLHEDSLSSTKLDDPWGNVALNLQESITDLDEYDKYANTLNAFHISAAAVSLRRIAKKNKYGLFYTKANERINFMNNRIDLNYEIDKSSLRSKAIIMYFLMSNRMLLLIYILGKIF